MLHLLEDIFQEFPVPYRNVAKSRLDIWGGNIDGDSFGVEISCFHPGEVVCVQGGLDVVRNKRLFPLDFIRLDDILFHRLRDKGRIAHPESEQKQHSTGDEKLDEPVIVDGKQKGKGRCHEKRQRQPDERQNDVHLHKTGSEEEGQMVVAVEQGITLQDVVPDFDEADEQDQQTEMPAGACRDALVLPREHVVFHPVEQDQADEEQQKGNE